MSHRVPRGIALKGHERVLRSGARSLLPLCGGGGRHDWLLASRVWISGLLQVSIESAGEHGLLPAVEAPKAMRGEIDQIISSRQT